LGDGIEDLLDGRIVRLDHQPPAARVADANLGRRRRRRTDSDCSEQGTDASVSSAEIPAYHHTSLSHRTARSQSDPKPPCAAPLRLLANADVTKNRRATSGRDDGRGYKHRAARSTLGGHKYPYPVPNASPMTYFTHKPPADRIASRRNRGDPHFAPGQTLVPRTRSSHAFSAGTVSDFRVKNGTRTIKRVKFPPFPRMPCRRRAISGQ